MNEFWRWFTDYHINDICAVIGVLIAIVGFGFTLCQVQKIKAVAIAARDASRETRSRIISFDLVASIVDVIERLKLLRHVQSRREWTLADYIYADIMPRLIQISHRMQNFDAERKATIQEVILIVSDFQE